ncbi:MAG: glycosyltransferase [Lachnospiraceae bacterium]|nr:glycosyltransferase [Lachnospiraceae bacterium]
MQQIKSYISKMQSFNRALFLSASQEFVELAKYLLDTKKIQAAYQVALEPYIEMEEVSEYSHIIMNCTLEEARVLSEHDRKFDIVFFDYGCRELVVSCKDMLIPYVVGRMKRDEDYFGVWECFRSRSRGIYIEQDKGIPPEEIALGNASCEILDWEKGKSDIELSVVIPVYNVAPYLPRCIESLIAWKAPYIEFLFVNDGSTDESASLIREYSKSDKRVILVDKENGGCASARNKGIETARGRYVGFVDSDDFIEENMFYKLLRRALMGNYDLTYCGYKEYYEDTQESQPVLNDCLAAPYLGGTYREDKVQSLCINTRIAIWRCLYKKSVLDMHQIRFHEDLKRYDDLPFRMEYVLAARSAACVPEYLYYYRLGRKGQDVSCTDDRLYVHFAIFEHLDNYVDRYKDKWLQDLLQVVKIQTHGYALSKIEKPYRKEYIKMTRAQLDRNMGYWRTVCLILRYTGKGNLGWYTRMKLRV